MWLVLSGCSTDGWCERFNFDCEAITPGDREVIDQDGDVWAQSEDCDDLRSDIYPGAMEICDGFDNDCDGEVDEYLGNLGYRDADLDGYGDPDQTSWQCDGVDYGWALLSGDCDDSSAITYPGARERCDEEDNNCDGEIDEDTLVTVYTDSDGDGYGDDGTAEEVCFEVIPPDTVAAGGDCDDTTAARAPGAPEVCFDLIDNNCDKVVDEAGCEVITTALYASVAGGITGADIRGDLNGDGYADLVAGVPLATSAGNGGIVEILHGSLGTRLAVDVGSSHDSLLYNASSSSLFGSVVATLRDADGDGYDELAVSAPGSAEVFVFRAPLPASLASTAYDMRISGSGAGALGTWVASEHDLTGDGLPDLLLGRGENTDSVVASLFTVEDASRSIEDGTALTWSQSWGTAPPPLATGDLTGDGVGDVVATFDETIYLLAGPLTAAADFSAATTTASTVSANQLGAALATADLDGDGYTDLLAGAPEDSQLTDSAGAVYVLPGPLSGTIDADTQAAAIVFGEANYDRAGGTLATADRDQDGLPDLIIGASAQYADFSPIWSGTYTVLGPLSGTMSLVDANARLQDTSATGLHPLIVGGADITGDGLQDVLVGAPRARNPSGERGVLYILPRTF